MVSAAKGVVVSEQKSSHLWKRSFLHWRDLIRGVETRGFEEEGSGDRRSREMRSKKAGI